MGKFNVRTQFDEAGTVVQSVTTDGPFGQNQMLTRVIHTLDQQAHDALVAMGWTPPGADVQGKSSGESADDLDQEASEQHWAGGNGR